ncbi:MAG TPA: hypothetical protein VMU94_11340 [Streptosporangiaceae bacterium]|nr:hypothetical protein [Streptosporangiaceae bacterium]
MTKTQSNMELLRDSAGELLRCRTLSATSIHTPKPEDPEKTLCGGRVMLTSEYRLDEQDEKHGYGKAGELHQADLAICAGSDPQLCKRCEVSVAKRLQEVAEQPVSAPRCRTIGCESPATCEIRYNYRGEDEVSTDLACDSCADVYSHQVVLKNFRRTEIGATPEPEIPAEVPCPSIHPEHDAPCIAVADHLGDHRDAHGCLWDTSEPEIPAEVQTTWISPNGVSHTVVNGRCVTCGNGPHFDLDAEWQAIPALRPGDRVTLHTWGGQREALIDEVDAESYSASAGGTRRDRPELRVIITAAALRAGVLRIVPGWADDVPEQQLTPETATAEAIAVLGGLAARFEVESRECQFRTAAFALAAARVLTTVRRAGPGIDLQDAVPALRSLPGVVLVSGTRREIWVYRSA